MPLVGRVTSIMDLPVSRAIFRGFEQLFFFGVWELFSVPPLSNISYRMCYQLVILNDLRMNEIDDLREGVHSIQNRVEPIPKIVDMIRQSVITLFLF